MNVVIETDRLLLRTFTEDDAALLFELNVDPEVTRYTHDEMSDLSQAKKVLDEVILPQYALYQHGRWAALQKSDFQFIGVYRFKKIFWGKGFATEAAFACLQYGFNRLGFQKIVGRALPENLASIRVLEKCGLRYVGEEYVHGYLHKTYKATNPAIQL